MAEPVDLENQLRRYADAVEAHWAPAATDPATGTGDGRPGAGAPGGFGQVGPAPGALPGRQPYLATGPEGRRRPDRRLLLAAAAVLVAVAVAGAALVAVRRAGNPIDTSGPPTTMPADVSDAPDDSVAADGSVSPDDSVPAAPLSPEDLAAADRCRQAFQEMDDSMVDPNQPDVSTESMAIPDGVAAVASQPVFDGTARRVVFKFGGKIRSCVVSDSDEVSMGSLVFNEDDAFPVEADAIQPRGNGGEAADWVIQGKAGSDVTGVRARFADGSTFEGLVTSGWFIVDMSWPEGGPANLTPLNDVVFSWTLADGTERSSRSEFLTPAGLGGGGAPCAADPACIPAKVAEVQAEAARRQAAGEPFDQGPALADGVVSEEEFDAAMASFVSCSVAHGLSGYVAPAPLFGDWAIFSLKPNEDPGAVFGYNVLLWPGPGQPAVTPPPSPVTTPSGGSPFMIDECRTAHVDLVSTLASVQDEKRRYDENAALTTTTTS